MTDGQAPQYGLIGLGTMGSNLALNIAEKGNAIAVFNRTVQRATEFHGEAGDLSDRIVPTLSLQEFVEAIARLTAHHDRCLIRKSLFDLSFKRLSLRVV